MLQWIIQITGELLITVGLLLLLFVAWQLWWTNIDADRTQAAVSTLVQEFDQPRRTLPDWGPQHTLPQVLSEPGHGEVFGVVSIPKLGSDYQRPPPRAPARRARLPRTRPLRRKRHARTGRQLLLAGHRQTRGKVLNDIDLLTEGDHIYVRTKDGYYTYTSTATKSCSPTR